MARFALRHWTAILIAAAVAWWALFYFPGTPSFAVFELKRNIDARDGEAAARYVDFQSVVRHAGYEIVQKREADNPLGQLVGKGAVDLFAGPMAQAARQWATQRVYDGARDVQMPSVAVLGAFVLMHRDGDTAYTRFRDNRGREWKIHMARSDRGVWQIVEVENIEQLLQKLQQEEQKSLNQPASGLAP